MPTIKTPKTKLIKQKVLIQASPEEVYKALTNVKIHSEFTGGKATGLARKGCKFTAWDGYIIGKYLELEQGKRMLMEWRTTEFPEEHPSSVLEFTFKEKGKGTEIQLKQTGLPASQADSYKQGWIDYYWIPMKTYFETK